MAGGKTIMMQLGTYQFGISTAAYQELSRSTAYSWPTQERLGQLGAPQFTGPGDDTMSLPGVIYPEWKGGLGQVGQMRDLAALGKPQRMVDGTGASLGQWLIESVEETQTIFAEGGAARRIEFTLSLKRAPDPIATTATEGEAASTVTTTATSTGVSIPAAATTVVAKAQGLASSVSTAAKSLSGTLAKVSDQVQAAVAPYAAIAKDALGSVSRSLSVVGELQDVANRTLSTLGIKPTSINALLGAENLAARANSLVSSAESASAILRTSSDKLGALSDVPASTTQAIRAAQAAADRTVAFTRQTAAQAATIKG